MMPMGGPAILLRDDVAKELKLTEEQRAKLAEALRMPMGPGGSGGPGGPGGFGPGQGGQQGPPPGRGGFGPGQGGQQGPPPGRGGFGPGQGGQQGPPPGQGGFGPGQGGPMNPEQMEKREAEMDAKIKAILNEGQYKRYLELRLQLEGVMAIGRKPVADKLGLSDEQLQKVHEALRPGRQGFQGGPPRQGPPTGGPPGGPPDMNKMREEQEKRVMEILTPEQRTRWQQLLGKKFEFQRMGPGGPGGRGGPGGPGGPPPIPPGDGA